MISGPDFARNLQMIEAYFGRDLTESQSAVYYKELRDFQLDAFERSVQEICRLRKPMPGQFPTPQDLSTMIIEKGGLGRVAGQVQRGVQKCRSCYNTGYIEVHCERERDGYKYREMYRCGHCTIWTDESWDRPGFMGENREVQVPAMPRITIQDFYDTVVHRYKEKGIKAELIRFKHLENYWATGIIPENCPVVEDGMIVNKAKLKKIVDDVTEELPF